MDPAADDLVIKLTDREGLPRSYIDVNVLGKLTNPP